MARCDPWLAGTIYDDTEAQVWRGVHDRGGAGRVHEHMSHGVFVMESVTAKAMTEYLWWCKTMEDKRGSVKVQQKSCVVSLPDGKP